MNAYGFELQALRRLSVEGGEAEARARLQGLEIGVRLSRLVAEAQPGSAVSIRTRAAEGRLRIDVRVTAQHALTEQRAGLADEDAALRHLAIELAGMLADYATVTDVSAVASSTAPSRALPTLLLLPRGHATGLRPAGFLAQHGTASGRWSSPRTTDAGALAKLLMANPHLALTQVVLALPDVEVESARARLASDLAVETPHGLAEALGTPVRVRAAIVADGPPWTLPLRIREHLRGWFDFLDLDETQITEDSEGVVVPETVAGGLLRLPTTSADSFPGLPVEPAIVPLDASQLDTGGIRIGAAWDIQNRRRDVILDESAMSRHIHVVGEPGSGKSTILTTLALQIAGQGNGLLMLDPHGTTVDRVLRELPPQHRDRVLVIRCGDTENPVRLNPFAVEHEDRQDIVISDMVDAFQTLFDPRHEGVVGPRFQHIMRHALSTLATARGQRASLLDVARLLYDRDLLMAALKHVDDPEVRGFWENDILKNHSSESNDVIAWVGSKFTTFASNRVAKRMLATGADSLDPAEAMASGRIVLVDLDKGAAGAIGARMIGLLYLLRFWVAALDRTQQRPFGIIVDEAASFSAVALPSILSEGRKFGLQAVVAHQYMGQLLPALADALEGGAATRIVFRVGPDDARAIAMTTYPEFSPLDLSSLPQFTAAARVASSGRPLRPFTLHVDHNERVQPQPDVDDAVAAMTRRSIETLVDPHRDAKPMTVQDLRGSSGEGASYPTTLSPPDPEWLGDFLRQRRERRSNPFPDLGLDDDDDAGF